MKIRINGKESEYTGRPVLGELLRSFGIDPEQVAVEHNRGIVARKAIESLSVQAGDELEIIRFVGGG
ncbi:MAG: sulfur carrier protein ThiS [Syntrophobacteraceae bacterium]|nr:sulfur carrier protein ThiS [Syntrophobacteraceae bacterium]